MFLMQINKKHETVGSEIGKWIGEYPSFTMLIGIVISLVFVWMFTKVAKQIRTFDKD